MIPGQMPPIGGIGGYKDALAEILAKNADRSGAGTPVNKVPDFIAQMQKVRDRNVAGNGQGSGSPKPNPMLDFIQSLISKLVQGRGSNGSNASGASPIPGGGPVPTHAGGNLPQGGAFRPYDPKTVQGSGNLQDPSAYYDPNTNIPRPSRMSTLDSILASAYQRGDYRDPDETPFNWTSSNA